MTHGTITTPALSAERLGALDRKIAFHSRMMLDAPSKDYEHHRAMLELYIKMKTDST